MHARTSRRNVVSELILAARHGAGPRRAALRLIVRDPWIMNDARRAMTASRTEKATFKVLNATHRLRKHTARPFTVRSSFADYLPPVTHWMRVNQVADAKRRQWKRRSSFWAFKLISVKTDICKVIYNFLIYIFHMYFWKVETYRLMFNIKNIFKYWGFIFFTYVEDLSKISAKFLKLFHIAMYAIDLSDVSTHFLRIKIVLAITYWEIFVSNFNNDQIRMHISFVSFVYILSPRDTERRIAHAFQWIIAANETDKLRVVTIFLYDEEDVLRVTWSRHVISPIFITLPEGQRSSLLTR